VERWSGGVVEAVAERWNGGEVEAAAAERWMRRRLGLERVGDGGGLGGVRSWILNRVRVE
jgi:hypothetical protein